MFEFHGWINIVGRYGSEKEDADKVKSMIDSVQDTNRHFHLHEGVNGQIHLVFTGFHNHRNEDVISFYQQVATEIPSSYGKLFVRDDEDERGYENSMRVWTMKLGQIIESTDEMMSPCISEIEPPFEIEGAN